MVTSGVGSVPCEINGIVISGIKHVLVSRNQARGPVLLKPPSTKFLSYIGHDIGRRWEATLAEMVYIAYKLFFLLANEYPARLHALSR